MTHATRAQMWTVPRRFSDFEKLRGALLALQPQTSRLQAVGTMDFPAKTWLYTSESDVEQRVALFSSWLGGIVEKGLTAPGESELPEERLALDFLCGASAEDRRYLVLEFSGA